MKAVYKTGEARGGFITATVAPANRAHEPRFGFFDGVVLVALVVGIAAMMRMVLAN